MYIIRDIQDRIQSLLSYLEYSNENLEKSRQTKNEEIQKKIDVLRNKNVIYQGLSTVEVWKKIGEREMLSYDLWEAQENGYQLDSEFNLETEELELLSSFREEKGGLGDILYTSFVMMCVSFIEIHLIEVCYKVKTKDNSIFSDLDLKGNGIHLAYQFFEKTVDYKIDGSTWKELMLIVRLRNNLVHLGLDVGVRQGNGLDDPYIVGISPTYQDFISYLDDWKIFIFPSIVLNYDYCLHLVEFTDNLFKNLVNDLREKNLVALY